MKNIYFIFITISIILLACQDDKSSLINNDKTNFTIERKHYMANETKMYKNNLGSVLEITNSDFKLLLILSDNKSDSYQIVDKIKNESISTARCILKLDDKFYFSKSGYVTFNAMNNSGTFSIKFDNITISSGKLNVNSVINHGIIDFTTISSNNYQGHLLDKPDKNDWIIRNNLHIIERLIFNVSTNTLGSASLKIIQFPNPFEYSFQVIMPKNCTVDIVIVNENFEIMTELSNLKYSNFLIQMKDDKFKGNYYRLYYKIHSGGNVFYGSGDIKVKE